MSEPTRIRVFSVDDHRAPSEAPAAIINNQPDMVQVAQAANCAVKRCSKYREHHPDVTLMDLRLPDKSGIDAMIAVRAEFPRRASLCSRTFEGDVEISAPWKQGARGYMLQEHDHPRSWLRVIRQVTREKAHPLAVGGAACGTFERRTI